MIYYNLVSFIIGLFAGKIFGIGWASGVMIIIIPLVVIWLSKFDRESKTHKTILCVLFLGLGILRISLIETSPDPTLHNLVGQKISFEAIVSDEPDIRDSTARYTVKPHFSPEYASECTDIFLLENSSCSLRRTSQGTLQHIPTKSSRSQIILVADRFPQLEYGDKVLVSGKLDLPENFTTDNGVEFDYVSYLSKDNVHFIMFRPTLEKLGGGGNKIIKSLYSIKNNFVERIGRVVVEPNSSLLGGLIFGAKQSLGANLLEDFRNVGLIHIVVLSGYNLTVIASSILFICFYFGKRKLGFTLSIIILILFAIMVGLGATVVRAVIMAGIAILAKHLGRPNDALRALFVAGFLMLFWNPLILLSDPSFQLSFMATLGLILFSPIIYKFISENKIGKIIPDKWGLREIVSSTFAVQLFLLPLLIRMSGTFSIVSFFVNLIVLPFIPTIMLFGFLTGFFGFISTALSWPFGIISYILTQLVILITEFGARLPLANIKTGPPSLLLILIWYMIYVILYYKIYRNKMTD